MSGGNHGCVGMVRPCCGNTCYAMVVGLCCGTVVGTLGGIGGNGMWDVVGVSGPLAL